MKAEIVAGAPANYWTKLLTNAVWTDQALASEADSWISPEKLSVVTQAALKVCLGENGILDDPGQCHFDPSSLVCASPTSLRHVFPRREIAALQQDLFGHAGF